MFKKLKDKLAEEVKSSPQRIQQFAQAAQAAVTSASSSISDITNSDLFSIGDNDSQQSRDSKSQSSLSSQQNTFRDVSLVQPLQSPSDSTEYMSSHDILENQRQRRLSNSSFASDVSFRLPSYETPSMYHLQSDMEVSASEADERGFSSGAVSLDRVTKEQLYAAYRRTQDRYTKYRTQYGDLARHYKLLERENAKARSVLVETQDKALRRISELREQCSLEQSAKAHLEKALRIEIEEKNIKIDTLTTKVKLLQNDPQISNSDDKNDNLSKTAELASDVQLINLSNDNEVKPPSAESFAEITVLNNKIEKMEQLLNKYKESLKTSKEKNSQVTTELQILSNDLENKNKDIERLKNIAHDLAEANDKIQDLSNLNEELQNKINVYEFNKSREQSTLQIDLQKAQEEIAELRGKIEVFSKREEEYAISLAENKLSIHKELEGKEAEIKSLKDGLETAKKEIQTLNIVINDYKNNVSLLEEERLKLNNECNELAMSKTKITDLEAQIEDVCKKCQILEQAKTKADEEYKCLQLQLKQETAEKLAMIDRNMYLENKNTLLTDENTKKSSQINVLESELQRKEKDLEAHVSEDSKKDDILCELGVWKDKYAKLESEIQEERDELIKLQSEIEKLLTNHELLQSQNIDFRKVISDLESDSEKLEKKVKKYSEIEANYVKLVKEVKDLRKFVGIVYDDARTLQNINKEAFIELTTRLNDSLLNITRSKADVNETMHNELKIKNSNLETTLNNYIKEHDTISKQLIMTQDENNKLQINNSNLETKLNDYIKEHDTISKQLIITQDKSNKLQINNSNLETTLNDHIKEHDTISKQLIITQDENNKLQINNSNLETTLNDHIKEHDTISKQLIITQDENNKLQINNSNLETTLNDHIKEHDTISKQLIIIQDENNKLQNTINELQLDKEILNQKVKSISGEYENGLIEVNSLKEQKEDLESSINEYECKLQNLQLTAESEKTKCLTIVEKLNLIENEKLNLQEKNQDINSKNALAINELDKIKDDHKNIIEAIDVLKKENNILTKELDNKNNDINILQEDNKTLINENIFLKGQAESIAASFKNMEVEINELRNSHSEIETEKDHLNEVIEKLESNLLKSTSVKNIQTDDSLHSTSIVKDMANDNNLEPLLVKDYANQDQKLQEVNNKILETNKIQSMEKDIDMYNNELLENYNTLKTDYDLLREENRRYMSDIEGLQTYLTRISKENSVLNDKLREFIATSEHSTENNVSGDLAGLKSEIQFSKDKIDDLLRENSLLVEENLELKDQLQSQNYSTHESKLKSDNDNEISSIKEKYSNLLQENSSLENRLLDLEQINKSVNGNLVQMQEMNEKLRLSNEKLERRLDESLVSLRHLHSLQENTELEYLKNILYEYLTGTGTHSVTLAKVLSAIVKFDDMQTKLVLQKEKERQGFLRQLGII